MVNDSDIAERSNTKHYLSIDAISKLFCSLVIILEYTWLIVVCFNSIMLNDDVIIYLITAENIEKNRYTWKLSNNWWCDIFCMSII
jgi:hypothetical protein